MKKNKNKNIKYKTKSYQAGLPVNSNFSKLTDFQQSKIDFCDAFGGAFNTASVCFDGQPVTLKLKIYTKN